jgi:hypothetical protein
MALASVGRAAVPAVLQNQRQKSTTDARGRHRPGAVHPAYEAQRQTSTGKQPWGYTSMHPSIDVQADLVSRVVKLLALL